MRYENIGWIGLGRMGGAMAENLYREGYLKYAFNRTPTVTEEFVRDKKDVKIAESLKELGSNTHFPHCFLYLCCSNSV